MGRILARGRRRRRTSNGTAGLVRGADEEGGGPYNGVDWLLKNRRELIDAEFCLNEGGWGEARGGKRLLNLVQVGEKHSATYRLEVKPLGDV